MSQLGDVAEGQMSELKNIKILVEGKANTLTHGQNDTITSLNPNLNHNIVGKDIKKKAKSKFYSLTLKHIVLLLVGFLASFVLSFLLVFASIPTASNRSKF